MLIQQFHSLLKTGWLTAFPQARSRQRPSNMPSLCRVCLVAAPSRGLLGLWAGPTVTGAPIIRSSPAVAGSRGGCSIQSSMSIWIASQQTCGSRYRRHET